MPMRASQVLADIRVSANIPTLVTAALGQEQSSITQRMNDVSIIAVMHYTLIRNYRHIRIVLYIYIYI